jgi:hypothetical protein
MEHGIPTLRKSFFYGLLGGIIATILLYIGTSLFALPYPPEAIFQLLIFPVPGSVQSVVVETFREYAKYTTFVVSAGIYAIMYALLGVLVGFLFGRNLQSKRTVALVFGTAISSIIAIGLDVLLRSRSSALAYTAGWLISGGLILGVNLVYAGLFVQQMESHLKVQRIVPVQPTSKSMLPLTTDMPTRTRALKLSRPRTSSDCRSGKQ